MRQVVAAIQSEYGKLVIAVRLVAVLLSRPVSPRAPR
jgi:hypothetical protein